MARDFRASNIRTAKIIGSASMEEQGGYPILLVYSENTLGVNTTGGFTTAKLLSGVDGNTWLFISGSKATGQAGPLYPAEVMFGGDINVAGDIATSGSFLLISFEA